MASAFFNFGQQRVVTRVSTRVGKIDIAIAVNWPASINLCRSRARDSWGLIDVVDQRNMRAFSSKISDIHQKSGAQLTLNPDTPFSDNSSLEITSSSDWSAERAN